MTPNNYKRIWQLAIEIEQAMFERGEYDYPECDRIEWLQDLPEPYILADDITLLGEAREQVETEIRSSLLTTEGRQKLINYLEDGLRVMDEEDELQEKFFDLKLQIKRLNDTHICIWKAEESFMREQYRNKAEFVRKLGELLNEHTNHRTGVVKLVYHNDFKYINKIQNCYNETVEIVFDNGNSKTINITGDSELAIMYDVYKYLI